jgi:hypothetical protein
MGTFIAWYEHLIRQSAIGWTAGLQTPVGNLKSNEVPAQSIGKKLYYCVCKSAPRVVSNGDILLLLLSALFIHCYNDGISISDCTAPNNGMCKEGSVG